MTKEELKEMLTEMFNDGEIEIEVWQDRYNLNHPKVLILIDGDVVATSK